MDVRELVQGIQSTSAAQREVAEQQIAVEGAQTPDLILNALFSMLSDASTPDCQAAILVVKNLCVTFWSPAFAQFKGPIWNENTKQSVRSALMDLVATPDASPLIRQAAESIISRIASLEYPDQWPNLMDQTLELIMNNATCKAGFSLFKELLHDTVREQDFWQYGQQLMTRMFEIIKDYRDVTQLYALQCFHECMNFFLMGEDDAQLQALEKMAASQLSDWNDLFAKLLVDPNVANDFVHELIDTLQDLTSGFPEIMSSSMPKLMQAAFSALETGRFSGDVVALVIDFLEIALKNSSTILNELRQDRAALDQFLGLCIELAKPSQELRDLWLTDFNAFVTHEQELSVDVWPRPSVGTLVGALQTADTVDILLSRLSSDIWIEEEACLYLVSCALQQLPAETQRIQPSNIEKLQGFLTRKTSEELLFSRIIITSGYVAKYLYKYLTPELRVKLVTGPLDYMHQSEPILVSCALLKTTAMGCSMFPEEFKPHQGLLLRCINEIIPEAEDETPTFLVECFLQVLRLDFDAATQYSQVFEMFFALVSKGTANIELNADILDLVSEMMDSSNHQQYIVGQLLSPVLQILQQAKQTRFEYSSDLQFALDICGVVFEKCSSNVIDQDKKKLVALFQTLVLECSDSQILQAGSFGYAALMEKSNFNELTQEEVQQSLQVTAKLLDPDLQDSAALAAGRLITALLDNFSGGLGEILGQVFIAAAKRQIGANHAYLVESLGLAFADLFIKDARVALDLLDSQQLLAPQMRKWLQTFEIVRGADEILKYITAMEALFDLDDPRLCALMVDDEAITRDNGLPMTRSKGLKFTQVPLPLKVIKLLINTLEDNAGSAAAPALENTGDEDEDEWADELVFSLDGGVTDSRAFQQIMDWFKNFSHENMRWYQQLNNRERAILLNASKKQ